MIYSALLKGQHLSVVFQTGDISMWRDDQFLTVWADGVEIVIRKGDLINIEPANGKVHGWLELRVLRAKARLYATITRWLVKINTLYVIEGSPDHRYYYWFVKDNSVERVGQRGAFRCDNWRPIVDDTDLEDFHQDLLRFGSWTSAR